MKIKDRPPQKSSSYLILTSAIYVLQSSSYFISSNPKPNQTFLERLPSSDSSQGIASNLDSSLIQILAEKRYNPSQGKGRGRGRGGRVEPGRSYCEDADDSDESPEEIEVDPDDVDGCSDGNQHQPPQFWFDWR